MKLKKYISFIVGGGIALLLLIVALVFLVRYQGQYAAVQDRLNSEERTLSSLNGRDPFPSEENLRIEKDNLLEVTFQLADLRGWMEKDQIKMVEFADPTEFQVQLNPRLRNLRSRASAAGVRLSPDFKFGFPKYAQGQMPLTKNVPRLSRQVQMVESLCSIMFDERIDSLTSITRQNFDGAGNAPSEINYAAVTGGRGGSARGFSDKPAVSDKETLMEEQQDDQGMYAWENFTMEFSANESALWNTLRSLANTNLLVSVESLRLKSIEDDLVGAARSHVETRAPSSGFGRGGGLRGVPDFGLAAEPETEMEKASREKRVVAGGGALNVTMKVNFYRLLDEKTEEEIQE